MDISLSHVSGSTIKLQDLCRMCAAPCPKAVQIFGPEGVANELSAKFCSYLPIKVTEVDSLPLQLCYECTNLLIQWDAAVLVATAADKKLRALQWQQQSQLSSEKVDNALQPPDQPPKRKASSGAVPTESISCSICKKSGMEFRELVEHLKSHDMPSGEVKKVNESDMPSEQVETVNKSEMEKKPKRTQVNEGLIILQKSVEGDSTSESDHTTEPPQPMKRKLRSNRIHGKESQNLLKEDSSGSIGGCLQGKKWKGTAEGGSGDPVVTSSTSSKISERLDCEEVSPSSVSDGKPIVKADGRLMKADAASKEPTEKKTFKPKVRIISAESINQSLEERAKANRNASLEGTPGGIFVPASDSIHTQSSSSLKPAPSNLLSKSVKPTRIVISGGCFKDIKNNGTNQTPKFLKLSDGRIIRILENPARQSQTSKPFACASTPVKHFVPKTQLSKFSPKPALLHLEENHAKPAQKVELSPSSNKRHISLVSPLYEDDDGTSDVDNGGQPSLKQKVTLSNTGIITFNLQPGPKNSVNRFTCVFCGKRNLQQDCLHQHAQTHCPKISESDQNTSSPKK